MTGYIQRCTHLYIYIKDVVFDNQKYRVMGNNK